MEVRFMDNHFNTTKIVDAYSSCIWNDNYIGYGDFELVLPMEYSSLNGINIGAYASIRESDRYMVVETTQINTSLEDGDLLTVTGRSLEVVLTYRIVRKDTLITGNLQDGIMRLLNDSGITPDSSNRNLPGLHFKKSEDPEITKLEIELELVTGDNLYDAIYAMCEVYHLGFRILPMEDGKMEFELYRGIDRSYNQSINPWIIFSHRFENLTESSLLVDESNQKTVIFSDMIYKRQIVDSNGEVTEEEMTMTFEIGESLKGFDRREIYKEIRGTVEQVDISKFGTAKSRVNIRDYQTWEPVYFDREAYEKAYEKWEKDWAASRPDIKEEKQEWKSYWKDGSADPGWQEAHPDEPPFYWVLETIPGTDAKQAAAMWEHHHAIGDREPKKDDFMEYDWVLTDPLGYEEALREAQQAINAEFNKAVDEQVEIMRKAAITELTEELAKYSTVTNFNGQIDSNVQYKFGEDYYLGDIVQIVNKFDIQATTRVVGMLYSQEPATGFIMRPTFTSDDEAVFEI